jgi:NAD(P)H-nitrite reductase large subunit
LKIKYDFNIMAGMDGTGGGAVLELGAAAFAPAVPRRMTRCECAGVAFAEVARRIEAEGASLDDVRARTGCARTCQACLPDLLASLAARS